MPGKHKGTTISFYVDDWQKAMIDERAKLSGLHKKDFIARSCIYSNIVVVGTKENVQRIIDEVINTRELISEIAEQLMFGNFSLSEEAYQELKRDYLAFAITIIDVLNGASYMFNKSLE